MSEFKRKPKRQRLERQEWEPSLPLKILHSVWKAAFALFKIAVGTVSTVLLICTICALVFVGIAGTYLMEDIVPHAGMDLENYDLDQTSFMYYQDSDGKIQELQQTSQLSSMIIAC